MLTFKIKIPLILILPMGTNYTLEEVRLGHYLLWDYISKSDDPFQKPREAASILHNACYACQYAHEKSVKITGIICSKCPIKWGSSNWDFCCKRISLDWFSAFDEWANLLSHTNKDYSKLETRARDLARQIRDVPWKDGLALESVDPNRFKTKVIFDPTY